MVTVGTFAIRQAIELVLTDGKRIVTEDGARGNGDIARWGLENRAGESDMPRHQARTSIVSGLLAGVLAAIPVHADPAGSEAGAGRPAPWPAVSYQAAAVLAAQQPPPAAAAWPATPVAADDVEANRERLLARERERADALARDLVAALRQIAAYSDEIEEIRQAGKAAAQKLQQSLQEERERVAAVTGELAAARRELEARGVLATTAASEAAQVRQTGEAAAQQLSQALAEERERVAALTRDLATARREIEARIAPAATAAEPAASAGAPPRPTPKEERQKADLPTGESAALGAPTSRDPGSAQRSVAPDPQALTEAKKLLTRADALLGRGDISAARIVLGRALDLGSPQAAFRLAESYDPIVLSARRALGTRPDPARARELYAQAYEGGIQEAKDRMDALR
jgi:hypothetical protein